MHTTVLMGELIDALSCQNWMTLIKSIKIKAAEFVKKLISKLRSQKIFDPDVSLKGNNSTH